MLYQEQCSNLRNLSQKFPEIHHQDLLPPFLLEMLGCHRMIECQVHLHPMILRPLLRSLRIQAEEVEVYLIQGVVVEGTRYNLKKAIHLLIGKFFPYLNLHPPHLLLQDRPLPLCHLSRSQEGVEGEG